MNRIDRGISILLLALLAACGGESDADREPPTDTVFDPLLENLDKAEQAGDIVEGRVDQLNRALEEQEDP